MKVSIVHSYYSSRQPSGENIVVDAQAEALRQHGIEVRVIAARTDELESQPGYKVRSAVNVATGWGASPLAELREFAPDIVHVHNLFPNWNTGWLEEWHGPIVATVHNFRPVCAAGTLFRDGKVCTLCPDTSSLNAVKHACYRGSKTATLPLAIRSRNGVPGDRLLVRADQVILLSDRARDLYSGFGLATDKTAVIPNFVDDVGFTPRTSPGSDWLYIGRLSSEKGIANLIKYWPRSERLNVYGTGPLQALVEAATALQPNIKFLGHLDHSRIPAVLSASRGLVFPSEWAEGLPLVYAESLAAGRAVVAKSGNSAADDVAATGTGAVFESWTDLAEALGRVSAEPEALGCVARERFDAAYTRRTWVTRTLGAYGAANERRARLAHA